MSDSSIWPIDRTLSGAISPGQSEPGSDGNEEVLHFPQSLLPIHAITEASSDCLSKTLIGGVLPLWNDAVSWLSTLVMRSPHNIIAQVLDCGLEVSKFKLQLFYYVPSRTDRLEKSMSPLIPPAMD